jgi:glycerophosphoryl diester phosphodiesterase
MKTALIILIGVLLFSCKKGEITVINLNNNHIELMGHGGMGYSNLYPTNTAESILKCLGKGADGSEIDIQLTADNQLVAFHNATLNENTNFKGKIRDYSWNQLKDVRYTSTAQLNYKLMNLSEFLSSLDGIENYTFTLDIKLNKGAEETTEYIDDFTDALDEIYSAFPIENSVFIESQNEYFLQEMQSKNAQIKLYIYPQKFESGLSIAMNLGLHGISISNDRINTVQVNLAHSMNLFVTVWGVNNRSSNIDAVQKNPDMIQTDAVNHLVRYLKNN